MYNPSVILNQYAALTQRRGRPGCSHGGFRRNGLSVDSGNVTEEELRLQIVLNTRSVFVFAHNEANTLPQPWPLTFNEASTVKLEFWVKNRPKS